MTSTMSPRLQHPEDGVRGFDRQLDATVGLGEAVGGAGVAVHGVAAVEVVHPGHVGHDVFGAVNVLPLIVVETKRE